MKLKEDWAWRKLTGLAGLHLQYLMICMLDEPLNLISLLAINARW